MDIWNNGVGRSLAGQLPDNATDAQIADIVFAAIDSGLAITALSDTRRAQEPYLGIFPVDSVSGVPSLDQALLLAQNVATVSAAAQGFALIANMALDGVSFPTGWAGGSSRVLGTSANESLFGSTVSDWISGEAGNDVIDGRLGKDYLFGGEGDDWLGYTDASESAASVIGQTSEGKEFTGGTGNDHITGTANVDTYFFAAGDGQDILHTRGGWDKLVTSGGDAKFVRDGIDLLVRIEAVGSTSDCVRIADWFTYGSEQNQLGLVEANGVSYSRYAMTSLALHVEGANEGDYITGLAGYSDDIFGNGGDDNIYLAQNGPASSDTAHGGAGNDWIWCGDSNDFLYGGGDNDNLFGGAGSNTYGWAAGDGLDSIYSGSATDTLAFTDITGLSALTASRSGNDLLISAAGAGGGGVLLKNWGTGYGRMSITMPDGTTWTAPQIEDAFKPAVMGVNFPSGVTFANDFAAVIRNQGYEFANADTHLTSAFGFSWLTYVWDSGLSYAADTGLVVNGHVVREWGSSMGYVDNAYTATDPRFSVWSEFTYQFWENDDGSYRFSLVRESAGLGGQTYNYRDTDGDGGTDTWDVVDRQYRVNESWPSTAYVVTPSVTHVDLLGGAEVGSNSTAATFSLAVSAQSVEVPNVLATSYAEQLFVAGSWDVDAYLAQLSARTVGVAAELGNVAQFFVESEQLYATSTSLDDFSGDALELTSGLLHGSIDIGTWLL